MKYLLIFLLAISFNVSADAVDDGKAVLDVLSAYGPNAKVLTPAQMLSIVNRYNTANGFSNPWDETDNPVEYAAWPTNIEKATFFLAKLGGEVRSDIGRDADNEYDASDDAARKAFRQAVEDEL